VTSWDNFSRAAIDYCRQDNIIRGLKSQLRRCTEACAPDYSALAVWTRGNKDNMPLAQGIAATGAYFHRRRPRTKVLEDASPREPR
jgi:hypothetical protein